MKVLLRGKKNRRQTHWSKLSPDIYSQSWIGKHGTKLLNVFLFFLRKFRFSRRRIWCAFCFFLWSPSKFRSLFRSRLIKVVPTTQASKASWPQILCYISSIHTLLHIVTGDQEPQFFENQPRCWFALCKRHSEIEMQRQWRWAQDVP